MAIRRCCRRPASRVPRMPVSDGPFKLTGVPSLIRGGPTLLKLSRSIYWSWADSNIRFTVVISLSSGQSPAPWQPDICNLVHSNTGSNTGEYVQCWTIRTIYVFIDIFIVQYCTVKKNTVNVCFESTVLICIVRHMFQQWFIEVLNMVLNCIAQSIGWYCLVLFSLLLSIVAYFIDCYLFRPLPIQIHKIARYCA